jgi:hypothetical protein
LAIDCSSTGDNCINNWPTPYPVSFTTTNATSCTVKLTLVSGTGGMGSVSTCQISDNTGSLTYDTTGVIGPSVVNMEVTVIGAGGSTYDSIDINVM